jgi:proteinaceous RNase P
MFFTFSRSKHILKRSFFFFPLLVVRANVSHIKTRVSITDQPQKKNVNLGTAKENGAGFSSARAIDERIERNAVNNLGGSVVEKTESTKDKNVRKNLGFRERRKVGSGNSSLRSKDEKIIVNSTSVGSFVVKRRRRNPRKVMISRWERSIRGRGLRKMNLQNFS